MSFMCSKLLMTHINMDNTLHDKYLKIKNSVAKSFLVRFQPSYIFTPKFSVVNHLTVEQ